MKFTDKQLNELFHLPLPTWLVMVFDKKNKYLFKSYARSLTSTGACKAVRNNMDIDCSDYLKAHMVSADDTRITWSQWETYLKHVGRTQELERLNYYRQLVLSDGE